MQLPGGAKPLEVKRELLSSIGIFISTGMLGFWFGVGAALGAKMVNSLEEFISSFPVPARSKKWQKKIKHYKNQNK